MGSCGSCQRCEWSEQTSCKSHCEHMCQSSCERSSQGCSSNCQSNCQSRCERHCQSSCEGSCETSAQKNRAPYSPNNIKVPNNVKGGTKLNISWDSVIDPDNNLSGYKLERSVDNKSYSQIYSGGSTSFSDTIVKGWSTVKYRVSAYDTYGDTSGYRESSIIKVVNNSSPSIIGGDINLTQQSDFDIEYIIQDEEGNPCTIDLFVDDVKKIDNKSIILGEKNIYKVKINDFSIGPHKVKIIAKDNSKGETERIFDFIKTNTAPSISGFDEDLGGKSTQFNIPYRVEDINNDNVKITILLDDIEKQNIESGQNQELIYTVLDSDIKAFEIGTEHSITIKADDKKGGIAYRRYTFTRTNRAPIISGSDTDLGNKKETFEVAFTVTDEEHDEITFVVYLDDVEVMTQKKAVDAKQYKYKIPLDEFIKLEYGKHTIKIVATDEFNIDTPSVRTLTFTRVTDGLEVHIKINEFTTMPKKVIAVPHGTFAEDAKIKVYCCNNYLDNKPTWEDMSTESKNARAHSFTNKSKTNAKWSIGVKFIVENGSSGISSILRGFKGGYE